MRNFLISLFCVFTLSFVCFGGTKIIPAGQRLGDIPFDTYMWTKADIIAWGGDGCDCPKEKEVMGIYTNICRALHVCVNSYVPDTDDSHALAVGKECRVYNWNGIAYGYKATDTSQGFGVTLGYSSKNSGGYYNTAVGAGASASGNMATAIGGLAKATESAVAFGYKSEADGEGAVAFGAQSKAKGKMAIAYGKQAEALAEKTIQFGKGQNKKKNTVQFWDKTVKFYENCPYFELWLDYDAADIVIQASTNNFKDVLFEYSSANPEHWKGESFGYEVYINYTTNDVNKLFMKNKWKSLFEQVSGDTEKAIQVIFCLNGHRDHDRAYIGWCYEDNKKLQWRWSQHTYNREVYGWKYIYPNVWHRELPTYTTETIPTDRTYERAINNGPSVNSQLFAAAKSVESQKDYDKIMGERIWIDPYGHVGGRFKLGGWHTRGELLRQYPKVLPMLKAIEDYRYKK